MTTNVRQRRATPPDPWATAPVAVGHHRRRLGWGLVVLVLVGTVALVLLLTRPSPTTSPTTPPAPAPTAPAAPPAAPSVPFDVAVEVTDVSSMDNDRLFGRDVAIPDGAVDAATQQVEAVLQAYLDAEFVTPETRFSEQPLDGLLSQAAMGAMSQDDLAGLGALGVSVQQVEAEPVMATARVLTKGSDAVMVEVRYDARAQVLSDEADPVPLHQRATMVFVPDDGGWRAEAVRADLDLPLAAGGVAR